MKRCIKSDTIESDFIVHTKFKDVTIEILPTNKIRVSNGRHIENLPYTSEKEIPEIVYNYLNGIL